MISLLATSLLSLSLMQGAAGISPEALEWFRHGEELIGTALENTTQQAEYFEKAVKLAPDFIPARYNLALVYIRLGRDEDALAQLHVLIESSPDDPRAYLLRARLRMEGDLAEEAVRDLVEAVRLDPDNDGTWQLLGRARYQLQDYSAAAEAFQQVIRLRPDPFEAFFDLALSQHALGRHQDAEQNYREFLEFFPDDFQGNYLLGRLYREMGRDEQARKFFLAAETIQPESPELAQEFAYLLLDFDELEAARERLLRSDLESPANLGNLGVIAMRTEDPVAAEGYFRKSLAADPKRAPIWALLGSVLAEQRRPEAAVEAYETALRYRDEGFDTLFNLGTLYASLERAVDSIEFLTKALELDSDHGPAHFNLALVLDDTQEFEGAEQHYLRALELGVEQPHAHMRLMFILAAQGQVRGALGHMAAALKADPDQYVLVLEQELLKIQSELDSIRYTEEFNTLLNQYQRRLEQ